MADGSSSARVTLTVNGHKHEVEVTAEDTLVDVLRGRLGLTSCRETCGVGVCGTCTALVNGNAVSACLMPAIQVDGAEVRTAEGLADGAELSPLQQAFVEHQAFQCSFCTPGFLMSATALVDQGRDTTTREALAGHICRCGSYEQIVSAIEEVLAEPGRNR